MGAYGLILTFREIPNEMKISVPSMCACDDIFSDILSKMVVFLFEVHCYYIVECGRRCWCEYFIG